MKAHCQRVAASQLYRKLNCIIETPLKNTGSSIRQRCLKGNNLAVKCKRPRPEIRTEPFTSYYKPGLGLMQVLLFLDAAQGRNITLAHFQQVDTSRQASGQLQLLVGREGGWGQH